MSGKWQGKSRGGRTGYQIFIFLIRHLGVRSAYVLLFFVSLYFIPAAPKSTRTIWAYARKILKYNVFASVLFIWKNYFSFGKSLIDKTAISSGLSGRYNYQFDGIEPVLKSIEEGSGAIFICAHFGNWAAGESFFRKHNAKMNLVMYDNEYESIKQVLEKNNASGCLFNVIPVNGDSLAHVFMITEALERGESVCFMGDRYLNEDKLIAAELMGKKVSLPYGPFLLASRMKVPVFFFFSERLGNMTYNFKFRQASVPARNGQNEIAAQFTSVLEEELKLHPEQWYNYYDFWNLAEEDNAGA